MSLKVNDTIKVNQFSNEFEEVYIDLRIHENRMYADEEVARLPETNEDHIHRKEWEIRKASCKKLIQYLNSKGKAVKILEIGCGNGWLSYQLSQVRYSNVVGIDVNLPELQQAGRVFTAIPNLSFIHGDLDSSLLEFGKFDIIIFAASIQYFSSFPRIIKTALTRLHEKGEIHIIDSHFYLETEIEEAKKRSHDYFHSKGFEKMNRFYFHRSLKELDDFRFTILYDPNSMLNKILKKKNPFHWICIRK